jgi:hypothetical protein
LQSLQWPPASWESMHRECVVLHSEHGGTLVDTYRRLRGCIQGLGGRGPKARGPLRCCRRVYARSRYLSACMPGVCVSARLWACANRKGGTRRRPQSEKESTAGPPVCQRKRRARAQPRSLAKQACMHALMRSRPAHALTPKISTTRMKTGTNTLTDTSRPAIPPIALATRRQTESATGAELRKICELSGHSGRAGVRSSPAAHKINRRLGQRPSLPRCRRPVFSAGDAVPALSQMMHWELSGQKARKVVKGHLPASAGRGCDRREAGGKRSGS